MKAILLVCAFVLSSGLAARCRAQTASARVYCLSARFQQGSSAGGFTLDLSTLPASSTPNGELAPTFAAPSHFSGFILNDPSIGPIFGSIAFNAPLSTDANNNGFSDFYEVSQATTGNTTGTYNTAVDNGTVRAGWGRASGSNSGTCTLRLTSSQFGSLGDFIHAFELVEYSGSLSYVPNTNRVSGTIDLTRNGVPTSRLSGAVSFTKEATNRFDKLVLQPGVWTNAAGESFSYITNLFLRDTAVLTNYYGFVDFMDGDPTTGEADYLTWVLSVDDTNDIDGDRIPDFSDDPGSVPARPPTLLLSRDNATLLLTLSGTVGRAHEIQETFSLSALSWTTVSVVTLTNDPQTIALPWPATPTRFWRVRTE